MLPFASSVPPSCGVVSPTISTGASCHVAPLCLKNLPDGDPVTVTSVNAAMLAAPIRASALASV